MGEKEERGSDVPQVLWMQEVSDFTGSLAQVEAAFQELSVPVAYSAPRISLVLTNEHGDEPLILDSVQVRAGGRVRTVTFGGAPRCAIAPGARLESDAIGLSVCPSDRLRVRIVPRAGQNPATLGSTFDRTLVDDVFMSAGSAGAPSRATAPTQLFYYGLRAVLAYGAAPRETFALFGDSLINQGFISGAFARRLRDELPGALTLNCGISGNRLLRAGSGESRWARSFGPAATERFERSITFDRALRPTATFALIGVNDLFQAEPGRVPDELPTAAELIAGFRRLGDVALRVGTRLVLGTLPPFRGSVNRGAPAWTERKEEIRREVNAHLRAHADVVDVDALVRDPRAPDRLRAEFDSGDHLHFSPGGGAEVGMQVFESLCGEAAAIRKVG